MTTPFEDLLSALNFEGREWIAVCHDEFGQFRQDFVRVADAPERAQMYAERGSNLWYSVNALTPLRRSRTKADVTRVTSFYVDIDYKEAGTDVAGLVADLVGWVGVAPRAHVWSGHGEHLYWPISDGQDVFRADALMKRFGKKALTIGKVDRAVFEIARILRIPGFLNQKDRQAPVDTRIEVQDTPYLTLDHIARIAPEVVRVAPPATVGNPTPAGEDAQIEALDNLDRQCYWLAFRCMENRNIALNRIAYLEGRAALDAGVPRKEVIESLYSAAIRSGLEPAETAKTIISALRAEGQSA